MEHTNPDGRLDRLEGKIDKLTDGFQNLQVSMERNRADLMIQIERVQSRDDVRGMGLGTKQQIMWALITALGAGMVATAVAWVAARMK